MAINIKELVAGALKPIADTIDNLSTSREEKDNAKLKLAEIQETLISNFTSATRDIIVAEASSDSWLTSNWRPLTMVSLVFIIMWNYVFGPMGTWFAGFFDGPKFPVLELPTGLWATINVGLGGYISWRSIEKIKLGKEK